MRPKSIKRSHWLIYNLLFLKEHFLGHRIYRKVFGPIEQWLFRKIERQLVEDKAADSFRVLDLEKNTWKEPLHNPYFPVVFRGAARDWPCSSKWDLDYFIKTYGDTKVTLLNNPGLVGNSDQHNEIVTMEQYIGMLREGRNKYLKFSRLVHDNSVLMEDFDGNWLKKFKSRFSFGDLFYFFIGAGGTNTPLHNGFSRTVFVQVKGSKKWIFYAPGDRIFMGVRPERTNYYFSEADPYALEDPAYPLMKHARKYEVTVNEGDVIYIPPLVWHQVENITDTIGVAYKFADIRSSFVSSKVMAFLYFFSTKPSLFNSTGHLWKKNKQGEDDYGAL